MKLKKYYRGDLNRTPVSKRILACLMIITSLNPHAYANGNLKSNNNPYLQTLIDSEQVHSDLNFFFNQALKEKAKVLNSQNKKYKVERFQSNSYLLNMPEITSDSVQSSDCNLNSYQDKAGNSFPLSSADDHKKREYTQKENNSYCLMQNTFSKLAINDISMVAEPKINDDLYNNAKNRLKNKDTLVIVIPGIFGEFIDQTAFAEMFGQGLAKSKDLVESNFTKQFSNYFKQLALASAQNKTDSEQITSIAHDPRFLIKKMKASLVGAPEKKFKTETSTDVDIQDLIKVSSYDDTDGKTLFKMAILGLEPMSLESLGKQEELSLIYLRRLNKFMEIYKKINDQYPDQIIFVGYSRGAPIAYEMLTILNKGQAAGSSRSKFLNEKAVQQKMGSKWSDRIVATLSLGGVSLGSSLADAKVIFRDQAPAQTRILQEFRKLIVNLRIFTSEDIQNLKYAHSLFEYHKNDFSQTDDKGRIIINLNPAGSMGDLTKILVPILTKLKNNAQLYNEFASALKEIGLDTLTPTQRDAINSLKSMLRYFDTFDFNRDLTLNSPKELLTAISDALLNASEFVKQMTHLDSFLEKIVMGVPELIPGYIKAIHSARDEELQVDSVRMKPFNDKILANFGLPDFSTALSNLNSKPLTEQNMSNAVTEFNNFIVRFQRFFQSAWEGGYELGTLSRLSWLANYGVHLPTKITYYSVSAVLQDEKSDYYQSGLGLGLNHSSDGKFLISSWSDITKVGNSNDGLDQTFAGTSWNDSQVDWYKTILWPSLYSDMTEYRRISTGGAAGEPSIQKNEIQLKSKVLGIVRTHHWGLALPFSTLNKTSKDPNTGLELGHGSDRAALKTDNVNPFPRQEFLLSTVLTIDADINANAQNKIQSGGH